MAPGLVRPSISCNDKSQNLLSKRVSWSVQPLDHQCAVANDVITAIPTQAADSWVLVLQPEPNWLQAGASREPVCSSTGRESSRARSDPVLPVMKPAGNIVWRTTATGTSLEPA